MKKDALEEAVAGLIRSMPPSDSSVHRLIEAAHEHVPMEEVAGIIAEDPNLCADLLYLANAPCWRDESNAAPIDGIEEALEVIGVNPLLMMVGPSCVRHAVKPKIVSSGQWHDYETHSRDISHACKTLAVILGMSKHDQHTYCVAGLTHDIGRAVIMLAGEPDAAGLVGTSPDKLDRIVKDEEDAYGMNHCQIGERLFRRWRVSKIMTEGILRHHSPLLEDDFCMPGAIIFVSHFVTMSDLTGETIAQMLPGELLDRLNLHPREIDEARKILA